MFLGLRPYVYNSYSLLPVNYYMNKILKSVKVTFKTNIYKEIPKSIYNFLSVKQSLLQLKVNFSFL